MNYFIACLLSSTVMLTATAVEPQDVVDLETSFIAEGTGALSEIEAKLCSAYEEWERLDEIESYEEFISGAKALYKEFSEIAAVAKEGSRVHKAAKLRLGFLTVIIQGSFSSPVQLQQGVSNFLENALRPFALTARSRGLVLREEIYQNVLENPQVFEAFKEFITLMEDDPMVALGYTSFSEYEVLSVEFTDEGEPYIPVRYKYERDGAQYESESGF